jgi:hypothetical protein
MKNTLKKFFAPLAVCAAAMAANTAMAELPKLTFCVFDPVGQGGEIYNQMQDYRLQAMKWGADLQLKAYSDESIATEDFISGRCDMTAVAGMRARAFNPFTGTIDSIGALPTYDHLKMVVQLLVTNDKMAPKMRHGDYEVAGFLPIGAAYLFTNDRKLDSVSKLAGKRIAILEFDKAQGVMVERIGASPVNAAITNFGTMFNNGNVDVIAAPALAYEPLELYRGLGDKGAVVNFALAQLTVQVLIRHEKFPAGFAEQSRQYMFSQYDRAVGEIKKGEAAIKENYWLELPTADKVGYEEMFRQTRLVLRDSGVYDGSMLKLMSMVRCRMDNALAECSAPDRE